MGRPLKPKRNIKQYVANVFGSFGYFFCCLQWFWAIMLYFSVVQSMISYVSPVASEKTYHTPNLSFTLPDPVELIVISIVVIAMVAVTIYILAKLPRNIVKKSSSVVHKATEAVIPITIKAQHKKDTKKYRSILTPKIVVVIKLLLVVIPIILTAASTLTATLLIDYSVAIAVGYGLACMSILFFSLQYIVAKVLHVKASELR